MTKAEEDLARTKAAYGRMTGNRVKQSSQFSRVCFHEKQGTWRVKVKQSTHEFYKEFKREIVAAWVADCVAVLMKGRDGMYDRDNAYCMNHAGWRQGQLPTCPDPDISMWTVYEWLLQRNIPVVLTPTELTQG